MGSKRYPKFDDAIANYNYSIGRNACKNEIYSRHHYCIAM